MSEREGEKETCETCRYFKRYYVRLGKRMYVPAEEGHCGSPFCRDKRADTAACGHHVPRPEGTSQ